MTKRLLVTGASGFLGWNLCRSAARGRQVFGTVFSHGVKIPGVQILRKDLTDTGDLETLFREVRPDGVIHTAAVSDADFCQGRAAETRGINAESPVRLAAFCAERGIPYVFTSSDLVFDGRRAPYAETDPVSPISVYGEQKVFAEEGVLDRYPSAAVCRLPLMFGPSGPVAKNFLQTMVEAMEKGQVLNLFTDEFRTPVGVETAVSGLFLALEKARGLIHLGGAERISRYDFGRLAANVLGIEDPRLVPCLRGEVRSPAPRPGDVSLDIGKARALGYRPGPLAEELRRMGGAA
jgi:dTDP-4-dehydrorhamnose reductase